MDVSHHDTIAAGLRRWSEACRLRADEIAAFPNRLSEPEPDRRPLPRAWGLIGLLTVLALIPRCLMAWRLPTICVDGAAYIDAAQAIARGEAGFFGVNFGCNLYPPILAALHYLGLSWEAAGAVWGVACSTLVVPSLFGWVRRQFDDRVAAVSCLIYAAHAELIEWSPETIRDQTFWMLFVASLYFLWRAVVEVRLRHFFLVGLLLPASVLTRFEGVFLLIPLVGWSWARYRALQSHRKQLLLGVIVAVGIAPVLLATMNAVWLKQESISRLLYVEPLNRVEALLTTLAKPLTSDASTAIATPEATVRPSPWQPAVWFKAFRVMERGIGPVFGLFFLGGLIAYGRLFLRSDHFSTVVLALAIVAGITIHHWYCGGASSRYILPVVIMSTRCAALAFMRVCDIAIQALTNATYRAALVPAMILLMTTIGWCDALTTGYRTRIEKAKLGEWIRHHHGDRCLLMGADTQLPIIGFYAHARTAMLPENIAQEKLLTTIDQARPDVVFVSRSPLSADACRSLQHDGPRLGLQPMMLPPQIVGRMDALVLERLPTQR